MHSLIHAHENGTNRSSRTNEPTIQNNNKQHRTCFGGGLLKLHRIPLHEQNKIALVLNRIQKDLRDIYPTIHIHTLDT